MSVSASAINALYYAWNTSTNTYVTGDKANHTLALVADGSKSSLSSPTITDQGGGLYSVALTGTQNTGTMMSLEGTSSTSNVVLIGIAWNNLPAAPYSGTPPTAAAIASAVWTDTTAADFTTAGSPGKELLATLPTAVAAIPTNPYTGTPPTAAAIASAVWTDTTAADFTTAGSPGKELLTTLPTAVAAIPTNPYTGTPPTAAAIASAVWTDTTAADFTTAGSAGASLVAIAAQTATLGSGVVTVNSFVSSSSDITIIRNADHKAADGTAWPFTDPGSWPTLTGATITLSLRQVGNSSDPAPLILTASTIAAGPPQVITFEATHTQTAALTPSTTADDYTFDIVAVLESGDRVPLLPEGSATVVCNVTGTGLPAGQPTPVALNAGSQW